MSKRFAWRRLLDGEVAYIGDDHSTEEGAHALAKRLSEYWADASGQVIAFEVYRVRASVGGVGVWGVRRAPPVPIEPVTLETPRGATARIVAETAERHGLSASDILDDSVPVHEVDERLAQARRECLRRLLARFPDCSSQRIAHLSRFASADAVVRARYREAA